MDAAGTDESKLRLKERAMEGKTKTAVGRFAFDRRNVVGGGMTLAAVSALGAGLEVAQAQEPAAPRIAPSPTWR